MNEKTVIIHDASVYRMLRQQNKINRRFVVFSAIMLACVAIMGKQIKKLEDRVSPVETDSDEKRGFHIEF